LSKKKSKNKTIKKIIIKASQFGRLPLTLIFSVILIVTSGSYILSKKQSFNVYAEGETSFLNFPIPSVLSKIFTPENKTETIVQEITAEELAQLEAERVAKETKEKKVMDLKNYLIGVGNEGFANSSKSILEASERCGVDYKLVVSIAGYESGYGKKPVKKYNPFGWLNGVQYGSWDEAVSDIICDFGSMYSAKGLHDPHQIVQIYVGGNGDKENWANTVTALMKKVP